MSTSSLEEMLAERPIDPQELAAAVAEVRQVVRAARLREIREAQQVTQVELAKELSIGQNRVSQIERGNIDHTHIDTLRRYVEALGGKLRVEAEFGDTNYLIA